MKECFIALREYVLMLWPSMLTGCPGVTWPRATRRLPSAVWNYRASLTGTAWRKRYWVEGDGRKGRPARRPKSARLTVSTVRIPAVSPKSDSKTRPRARHSFGRPSCLGGPNDAARSFGEEVGWRSVEDGVADSVINWLRVFKRANPAHLCSGHTPERETGPLP